MREYNNKISEKANKSLVHRALVVRSQKIAILVSAIIVISLIVLLCSSIHAFANSNSKPVNKYYTSIVIEDGDTLWTLADRYNNSTIMNKQDYIKEICILNCISEDSIHTGDSIIVSYYSDEEKY